MSDEAPRSWVEAGRNRSPVSSQFIVARFNHETTDVVIDLGHYDATQTLVIDPTVTVYCGYIGGVAGESVDGCDVDALGNRYLAGWTKSSEASFPATTGPNLTYGGQGDVFVAKLDPTGTRLLYCGYIGGPGNEWACDVAVDPRGSAYITGMGGAPSYPIVNGFTSATGGIFVTKLDPTGTTIVYSGFFGGNAPSRPGGIAVDAQGSVYVTGSTDADQSTFPVLVGPDLTFNGFQQPDCFVAKLAPAGNRLVYCGYIGGVDTENEGDIAVDALGRAYVTGWTKSDERTFPVAVGPTLRYHPMPNFVQQGDTFVARVAADGRTLDYCGYIGGFDLDVPGAIAVDRTGAAYVTGSTYASENQSFPVVAGPDLTHNGGLDAFVAKVHPTGSSLVYCGYVGGESRDEAGDIAVDSTGAVLVTGSTYSQFTFPKRGGLDPTYNGNGDVFVTKVDPTGTRVVLSGYLGGMAYEIGNGIALDGAENIYVAGQTLSDEQTFPVAVGPDLTYNDTCCNDAFVTKIAQTFLTARGAPRPGNTVAFDLIASRSAGRAYRMGSSLGRGPIRIDTRTLDLAVDPLLDATVNGTLPSLFIGYRGTIGSNGRANAQLQIPANPLLVGLTIYTAFVTLDVAAPSGILDISDTWILTIA